MVQKWVIICFLPLFSLSGCGQPKNNSAMEENKNKDPERVHNIIEKPDEGKGAGAKDTTGLDYDYVVSEAAFGRINGVPFTVGAIYDEEKDGKTVYTVTLDINKERFVDAFDGTVVELDAKTRVQVVKIEYAGGAPKKGKVYFKVLKK